MEKGRVMLCAGNSGKKKFNIKQGIVQRDSVSPLVFIDPIDPVV